MLRSLRRRSDELYRADGGREIAGDQHPRTADQRMFDAATSQITGARPDPQPPAGANSPQAKAPRNRPGERPTMVFTAKLTDVTDNPDEIEEWKTELVGSGVVPSALASYFRCISDHSAMLLAEDGSVLWKGRSARRVSSEQWAALVVQDEGCVLCHADHTRCEAHHLIPWESPKRGETNIDAMALLCVDCHHRVHEHRQTLYWDSAERQWRLRLALPNETPRTGRSKQHRAPPRQRSATPEGKPQATATRKGSINDRRNRRQQTRTPEGI